MLLFSSNTIQQLPEKRVTSMNEAPLNLAEPVGSLLKKYREESNRKQKDIAESSSISVSMLSQIERGITSPSIDTLNKVCSALNISMSQLFSSIEHKRDDLISITRDKERLTKNTNGSLYEHIINYKRERAFVYNKIIWFILESTKQKQKHLLKQLLKTF